MQLAMRRTCLAMLLPLLAVVGATSGATGVAGSAAGAGAVTPMQKVIEMLDGMLSKGKEEKHAEQVQFAAYKQFCDDVAVEKQRLITEANEAIDMLKAEIQKSEADATELAKGITVLDANVATWHGDKKAAAKARELMKSDYIAMHKDYSESLDALQRAIDVLKQLKNSKQTSLTQVSALKSLNLIPDSARRAIDLFLAQTDDQQDPLEAATPELDGYEVQSHSIIEILEKLLDKFVDERTDLEKKEMNSRHAFELLTQDLAAQIETATSARSQKVITKTKALQAKAAAEGDLTDTTSTRDADKKYLVDLTSTCETKSSDYSSRQQLRADEIQTLMKATEILTTSVTPAAEKYLPTLLQHQGRSALSQLRAVGRSPVQQRVADYLRAQGQQLHSRVLSTLAMQVAEDPFVKVKQMIKDLIARLMEEATEETEHKGWCDTELSTNEQTRKEKSQAVETLQAEIDELQASLAQLAEEVSTLQSAVADLDTALADAMKMRIEEKTANEATVKDSRDASTALAQAIVVMQEFYARAGDATALVQRKQEPLYQTPPAIFSSPYQGMQAENGGVIAMLEVVQVDFARLETDTAAAEATAQRMHDDFVTDSKVDKASKAKDIEYKNAKKSADSMVLTTKQSDFTATQRELDAALAYYDKLKPSCVNAGSSYEQRASRRKEEIESLQEALRILNGEDLA